MTIEEIKAKIKAGADLTDEQISAIDALELGAIGVDDIHKMTADAVREAIAPFLKPKDSPPVDPPQAYKPKVNGYSDIVRNLTLLQSPNTSMEARSEASAVLKAMSVGSGADGGVTVPSEWATDILRYINEYGALRQLATVVPTQANNIRITTRNAGMTAYWNAEASAATQSGITYTQVTVTPQKLSVLSDPISKELVADSFADMLQEVGIESMEAMAYAEDYAGFLGDGTSTYGSFTGTLLHGSVLAVSQTGTVDQLEYATLVNATKALTPQKRVGAQWVMHRSLIGIIEKIVDNENRPIFRESPMAGVPATVLGYPIFEAEAMPADTTLSSGDAILTFGNFRSAVRIYDRQELMIDINTQGMAASSVNLFATDQIQVKHMKREGIIVARPTALVNVVLA